MISVRDLYHSYTNDERYAVEGVTFEVKEGEIFGFLGPNGAGKSTTQRILTGLLRLQKGEVIVAGTNIRRAKSDFFNLIGVSFENPNIYRKLSGLENLNYFKAMYDVPTEDPMRLLAMVGLEEAATKKAGEYSKGMQQRLVFARSLLNRPKIWFLDEPTAGLDPTTSASIKDIIKEQKKLGTTVFLTTHNMYVADQLCDRVAFINSGEIVLIDSPRELKLRYGKRLVEVEHRDSGGLEKKVLSLTDEQDRKRVNELLESGSVETIHSMEATLEDIFIKVTGRELTV